MNWFGPPWSANTPARRRRGTRTFRDTARRRGRRARWFDAALQRVSQGGQYGNQKVGVHRDEKTYNIRETGEGTVKVQDFGIGIEKEHQSHIFDRFYRVSDPEERTYPGIGIGLYIACEIIKRHKGELWVMSEKGKGSLFQFRLPYQ